MNPSGSGPAYSAPGSFTLQFGVTRQKESQRRVLHVSATRPASRTTWSTLAWVRYQLVARPAWPAPTIATSTPELISAGMLARAKLRTRSDCPAHVRAPREDCLQAIPPGDMDLIPDPDHLPFPFMYQATVVVAGEEQ